MLKILAIIAAVLFAMFSGLALAVAGQLGFLVLFPLIAAALILYDYRLGVVVLAMIIPLSGSVLVPKLEGLNPYTYLSAAAIAGFMLSRFTNSKPIVWPPKVLLGFFVVPLVAAFLLSIPHLDELRRILHLILPESDLNLFLHFKKFVFGPVFFIVFTVLLCQRRCR